MNSPVSPQSAVSSHIDRSVCRRDDVWDLFAVTHGISTRNRGGYCAETRNVANALCVIEQAPEPELVQVELKDGNRYRREPQELAAFRDRD